MSSPSFRLIKDGKFDTLTVAEDVDIGGNVVINGNLTVLGSISNGESEGPPIVQGSWQALTNQPNFISYDLTDPDNPIPAAGGAQLCLLLTDGSVLVQNNGFWDTNEIWKLTPDINGSYVNGTWSQLASLPYTPLYSSNAVLADGRVIILGGEYTDWDFNFTLTDEGAIYDPVLDTWTSISGPDFFTNFYPTWEGNGALHPIGDSANAILEDGTFLVHCKLSKQAAIWNPKESALPVWTEVGTSTKQYLNSEEGFTLLPNGKVLTVNTYKEYKINHDVGDDTFPYPFDLTQSEIYDPETQEWSYGGSTIMPLPDTATTSQTDVPQEFEMGAAVLRPNGTVFCPGSNGNTSIYNTINNTWKRGPRLPSLDSPEYQIGIQDGPGVLLPNGNVLFAASPIKPSYSPPVHFFEFNGTKLKEQPTIPHATIDNPSLLTPDPAYICSLLMLPTGQVLLTDSSNDVEIFTPGDTNYNHSWAPIIHTYPHTVTAGTTYKIQGVRFNGMSQASMYGNENQCATNYPLVRIINNSTNHVFYCRTHDHSFMGVASDRDVYTFFDVPAGIESGKSVLEVVVNGIPSKRVSVKVL